MGGFANYCVCVCVCVCVLSVLKIFKSSFLKYEAVRFSTNSGENPYVIQKEWQLCFYIISEPFSFGLSFWPLYNQSRLISGMFTVVAAKINYKVKTSPQRRPTVNDCLMLGSFRADINLLHSLSVSSISYRVILYVLYTNK